MASKFIVIEIDLGDSYNYHGHYEDYRGCKSLKTLDSMEEAITWKMNEWLNRQGKDEQYLEQFILDILELENYESL